MVKVLVIQQKILIPFVTFCNIGEDSSKGIPRTNTAPDEFLRQKDKNSIFLYPASEAEVFNILNSLKNKKSSGHDGISNVLLKEIGY